MKFSANLGFLWQELKLPDAIHAAKDAGFAAVECHWPYTTPATETKAALTETGLQMLGLNTLRGDVAAGENGLAALPDRVEEARDSIDQAIAYATAIGAQNIHVMAGCAGGDDAHQTFLDNLRYAAAQAAPHNITILIEPLNQYDAPGYFLHTSAQAKNIIEAVGAGNLQLMFDCYHLQIAEGDITRRLKQLMPIIGHIQIASVPDRGAPDHGELDYNHVFKVLNEFGYAKPLGAEYKPSGDTDASLAWLQARS